VNTSPEPKQNPHLPNQRLAGAWRWIAAFGFVLLAVPLMTKIKECYPFSNFPMYSSLEDIWTLQLTNEKNQPLSTQRDFSGDANSIRKLTTSRLRQVQRERNITTVNLRPEDWHEAGRRTFQWLLENHQPRAPEAVDANALRLWRKEYVIQNGSFKGQYTLLIEYPMPGKSYTPSATAPNPPGAALEVDAGAELEPEK
jgi:hypothetical protein